MCKNKVVHRNSHFVRPHLGAILTQMRLKKEKIPFIIVNRTQVFHFFSTRVLEYFSKYLRTEQTLVWCHILLLTFPSYLLFQTCGNLSRGEWTHVLKEEKKNDEEKKERGKTPVAVRGWNKTWLVDNDGIKREWLKYNERTNKTAHYCSDQTRVFVSVTLS